MERLILALSLLTISFSSHAFTLNNSVAAAFDMDQQDPVTVNLADHGCTNINLSNGELLGMIQEAVDLFWNRVHTSSLRMQAGSAISVNADFQSGQLCVDPNAANCDINNNFLVSTGVIVSCNNNGNNFGNNTGNLAVSIPTSVAGDRINGSVVLIQDRPGVTFNSLSRQEQVAVIAHELGHAIGLGHTELQDNLMYFESVPTRNALGWDDVDGVNYLYPVEQPLSGCGTISTDFNSDSGKMLFTFIFALLIALGLGKLSSLKKLRKGAAFFLALFLIGVKKVFFL